MAADILQIEQRLASLEVAVSEVQAKLGIAPATGNWVDHISGSLADIPEADYQEFLDHCRKERQGRA